jgi:hypothetical protein
MSPVQAAGLAETADHPINRIDEILPWNVVLTPPLPVSQAA